MDKNEVKKYLDRLDTQHVKLSRLALEIGRAQIRHAAQHNNGDQIVSRLNSTDTVIGKAEDELAEELMYSQLCSGEITYDQEFTSEQEVILERLHRKHIHNPQSDEIKKMLEKIIPGITIDLENIY